MYLCRKTVVLAIGLLAFSGIAEAQRFKTIAFENVRVGGELRARLSQNLNRLEEEKYQPDHVFLTEQQSGWWPGDTEGRTILALVMEARALGRTPKYLDEIVSRVPSHLNKLGYMGTIHPDSLDEQQLSGNGWMLRGLCEYYLLKKDRKLLPVIRKLAESLFTAYPSLYGSYPIMPETRVKDVGEASGSLAQISNRWRLSSDIGCVFIGMEGLLHALQVTGDDSLRAVARQLVNLFLKVDLTGIKAQTHASLTAMRGLIRYADITGDSRYVSEAEKRWDTYRKYGMTECYGNYNWFCRYNTWTEPCAIVDSYIVASQLWQHTGKAQYRDDAELIYYNALCYAQRANGGFGLENNPGRANSTDNITPYCDEAHWCCTMRGGEGLGRAAEFTVMKTGAGYAVPFLRDAAVCDTFRNVPVQFTVETEYPYNGTVTVRIARAHGKKMGMAFAKSSWMTDYAVSVGGKRVKFEEHDGLAEIRRTFRSGDEIRITFGMTPRYAETQNRENSGAADFRVMYGPLVLGGEIGSDGNLQYGEPLQALGGGRFRGTASRTVVSPLLHLMSPQVYMGAAPAWSRRVIFRR